MPFNVKPQYDKNGLPVADSLKEIFARVTTLMREGKVLSCYTPTYGGIAEAILKMAMGNGIGFAYSSELSVNDIFGYNYGAFILETSEKIDNAVLLGETTANDEISFAAEKLTLTELCDIYENKLEKT